MTRIAYYLIDGRISKEDGARDAAEDDVEGSNAREDVLKLEELFHVVSVRSVLNGLVI